MATGQLRPEGSDRLIAVRQIIIILAALAIVIGLSTVAAFGQTTGIIVGRVIDTSGAVVSGAAVTAKNNSTGIPYSTVTGVEGFYTLVNMPPGEYTVTTQLKGFKSTISSNVIVHIAGATRVDLTLSPGDLTETVYVSAEAPLVASTTSDIDSVMEERQIESLPFNGRLFQTMVFLVPGTIPEGFTDQYENAASSGSTAAGGAGMGTYASVNGFSFAGNYLMVDGIHDNEPANDYININIPLAAIQEMKIETSNPTAEYGTFGGAVINVTTKSGTNRYHGQVFDYIRNQAFNAKDAFALTKAPYHANQMGGAFGGPIKRDKLFFFVDFQFLTQHAGQTYHFNVPRAANRTGDLSSLVKNGEGPITNAKACAILAQANGLVGGAPCTASSAVTVPGTYDTVPASDISPISAGVLNPAIVPLPNNNSATNAIFNAVNTEAVPQFDARVDYAFSNHDRFFVRESYLYRNFTSPAPGTPFLMGSNPNATNHNDLAALGWDHTFGPTLTNQLRIGFNRYVTYDFVDSFGQSNINNTLGIPNGNIAGVPSTSGIAEFTFQNISLGNSSGNLTGDPGPIPNGLGRLANIYEYSDALSKIWGRHTLKFGADIQHIQDIVANPQNDPRGCFSFNGEYTGNAFADFLVGAPGGNGCPGGGAVERDLFIDLPAVRFNFLGFYAQDDIRVNQQFTLNLGLRYDIYTTPVSVRNTQSNFVASGPEAGLIQLATSGNRTPNVNTYYGNLEPRVGFAYSPDNGKTALRAGFGISSFPANFGADSGTLERNYPELIQENFLSFNEPINGCTLPATPEFTRCGSLILANGLPGITASANSSFYPLLVPPSSAGGGTCLTGLGTTVTVPAGFVCPPNGSQVYIVAKDFRQNEVYSWNITAQREIMRDMSFQLAYVGNEGQHLFHDYQLNQCYPPAIALAPGTGSAPFTNYPNCLPYPGLIPSGPAAGGLILTGVHARSSDGESRYNALEAELQKRTSFGLTLQASYTWSKLLDNIDNPINAYDTSLQLVGAGQNNGNYPQTFVLSYVYDLPLGRGHRYLGAASGATQRLVSGWQVSGITTFRAGGTLLITAPTNLLPPGADQETANFLCAGQPMNNPHTASEWFNTSRFSEPGVGTIGTARTGDVYGPGFQNWDLSVAKAIPLWTEGRQMRFEANFFNVFNQVNLSNPDTHVQDANFGVITSDNGQPRQIQFGLKVIF
jgi:outer membrane receptor protein involved in Fe transport